MLGTLLGRSRLLGLHDQPVLCLGLGLGVLGQALFGLGLIGRLDIPSIVGLFSAITVVGILGFAGGPGKPVQNELRRCARSIRRHPGVWLGGSAVVLPLLALALYPPFTFDATLYHLPFTRAFAETGALPFLPTLRFPIFPQWAEVMSVPAYLLSSDVGAKLIQALLLLLTAALLIAWGAEIQSRRSGIWAAALWLGTPLAIWVGCSAYVDAALTFFITAAFYAWHDYLQRSDPRRLLLSGLFLGFAAATKYLALFFIGSLGLWVLTRALRQGLGPAWKAAARLSLGVLLVAAPWYARIYATTGSPLFPFYEPIFGAGPWTSFHDRMALETADVRSASGLDMALEQGERVVEGLGFLVSVPWRAVFDRGVFHWQAPFSPFLMVLLPLSLLVVIKRSEWRPWCLLMLGYGLFWLTTVRDLRFLLVVLPLLGLILCVGVERGLGLLSDHWPKRRPALRSDVLTLAVAVVLVAPGSAYAVYKLHQLGPLPTDPASRESFLSGRLPAVEALILLNDTRGDDYVVYGLFAENLRYFADGVFLGDWAGPESYAQIMPLLHHGPSVHARLREFDVDFLLVTPDAGPYPAHADLPAHLFEPMLERPSFTLYRLLGDGSLATPRPIEASSRSSEPPRSPGRDRHKT